MRGELSQVPHSPEAEQSVLGAMLIDPRCIREVLAVLRPKDFYLPQNRDIFEAIQGMHREGKAIDPVTVLEEMRRLGVFDPEQSRRYMFQLMEITPTAAHVMRYAEALMETALCRAALERLEAAREALAGGEDPNQVCAALQGTLESLTDRERSDAIVDSTGAMLSFLDYRNRVDGGVEGFVSTGYKALDDTLGGGLVKEGLYILAARPGVGKTTLGLQIADKAAALGVPVLFVSLEMSLEQLSAKRIAVETGIGSGLILLGSLGDDEYDKITHASHKLARQPIQFNRKPGATVQEVAFMARRVKRCGLVVIDYLGLLRHEGGNSLYERVTETSNGLKRLARSLGIPILCLAQLNRAKEQRGDKRPQLSDLRDSGAIEQDADGVLLLHRPLMGREEEGRGSDPAPLECYIAKNRHGAMGKMRFNLYLTSGRIRPAYP